LEEACAKYKAATDLCPTMHEVLIDVFLNFLSASQHPVLETPGKEKQMG
jgi:hypothetical protein